MRHFPFSYGNRNPRAGIASRSKGALNALTDGNLRPTHRKEIYSSRATIIESSHPREYNIPALVSLDGSLRLSEPTIPRRFIIERHFTTRCDISWFDSDDIDVQHSETFKIEYQIVIVASAGNKPSRFGRFSHSDSRLELWRPHSELVTTGEARFTSPGVPAIRSYSVYLARFIATTLSRGIRSFGGSFIRVWIRKLRLYIIRIIAFYHRTLAESISDSRVNNIA